MTSPTARTLDLPRRCGHLAAVVEKWLPKVNRRRDLFGIADVMPVHPIRREIVLIQCTTLAHSAIRPALEPASNRESQ